jgi:hypothetical protein
MSARSTAAALLVMLSLFLSGCEQEGPVSPAATPFPPGLIQADLIPSLPLVCGGESFDLLADQTLDVGAVSIANDEEYLYVTFETTDGWAMTETHLAVVTDPDLVLKAGKRVVPGKFPEKAVHDPAATLVHYRVPLDVLEGADVAIVAAHADIMRDEQEEGAWVAGTEIREGGGWASYASYGLSGCEAVEEAIGSDGGEVGNGDAILTIPQDALEDDVEISIAPVPDGELPDGVLPGTAFDFSPDGQEFAQPVTLVLHYDDPGLSPEEELKLAIHQLLEDGTLARLPTIVDPDLNTLTTEIMHFSIYAVAYPAGRLELRVDDFVDEGYRLEHKVWFWNDGTTEIAAEDVMLELTVDGPVELDGYSTGLCSMDMPSATSYHYTCVAGSAPIAPGTARVLAFYHRAASGSAGETIQAFASFAYAPWTGTTPTAPTLVEAAPAEADVSVGFIEPPDMGEVGVPLDFTIHVTNFGPATINGATLQIEVVGDILLDEPSLGDFCSLTPTELNTLVTCQIFDLPMNFAEQRTITFTPQLADQEIWVYATVTDIIGPMDPNLENNETHHPVVIPPPA